MQHHPPQQITPCKLLILQQIAKLLFRLDVVGLVAAFWGTEGGWQLVVAPGADVVVALNGA